MQDEVTVTQVDERAVAEFHRQSFETLFATTDADIDAGINRAHTLLCQAFARHRHQAERETLARMEWRDIESAPKDGRRFLVYGEQKPLRSDRFFLPNQFNAIAHYDSGGQTHKPMLKTDNGMPTHVFTHWMPLPPAPEAGQ